MNESDTNEQYASYGHQKSDDSYKIRELPMLIVEAEKKAYQEILDAILETMDENQRIQTIIDLNDRIAEYKVDILSKKFKVKRIDK